MLVFVQVSSECTSEYLGCKSFRGRSKDNCCMLSITLVYDMIQVFENNKNL